MAIDLAALQAAIRDGARQAFWQVQREARGEQIYAFALYTDDGRMTVMPSANSEEGLAERAIDHGFTEPDELALLRGATAEWKYEATGEVHLQAAYDLLNGPDREFEPLIEGLLQAMTGALRELDAEGCFGTGAGRERLTLLVSISDSERAEAVEAASMQALNPGRGARMRP